VWHVLTLGAMVTCGWLAAWQWQRAGSAMGSALNVGYGLQWPLFAVFFGVMWWRMLRMEATKLEETASAAPPAEDAAPDPTQHGGEPRPATAPHAPSPFGPRPRDVASPPVDDPELVAYNQMLAQLAARHPDR
jgi:DNA-binding transcriptional regulator of glucitol operon